MRGCTTGRPSRCRSTSRRPARSPPRSPGGGAAPRPRALLAGADGPLLGCGARPRRPRPTHRGAVRGRRHAGVRALGAAGPAPRHRVLRPGGPASALPSWAGLMHQFSFDFGDPFFDLGGWQIALQIITFDNVYGLDPELTRVEEDGGRWTVTAGGLTWAGGQRRRAGRAWLRATPAAPAGRGGGGRAGAGDRGEGRRLEIN